MVMVMKTDLIQTSDNGNNVSNSTIRHAASISLILVLAVDLNSILRFLLYLIMPYTLRTAHAYLTTEAFVRRTCFNAVAAVCRQHFEWQE